MSETMSATFDAIILGSGQAGNPLAAALAGKGWSVAVVESKHIGGTCVNEGCTPTKTMVASAKIADQARRAAEFGVHAGPVTVDMAEVRARKRSVVDKWRSGSEKQLEDARGVSVVRGEGSFAGPKTVAVKMNDGSTRALEAGKAVFVNTGLRSAVPPGLGLERVPYLTNESVMELDRLPEHLVVLGGSYIAVEFAQMFRRFGARVTVVSNAGQLLPREDGDVAACVGEIFAQDGIEVVFDAKATRAEQTGQGIALTVRTKNGEQTIDGSHLLLAAGRMPNTDRLNLAAAGLKTDAHGFLLVNERLETAVPGIYALGDVHGGPAFTHISYDDYRIIAANLLENGSRTTTDRQVPYTVFIDPELGRIGLGEAEAREAGHDIRVAKMAASSIARAFETGEDRGLMKVVVDRKSEQILGAAVLAGQGGEIMAVIQTAMLGKLPFPVLRDAIWAHPTWAEALNTVFFSWEDESK